MKLTIGEKLKIIRRTTGLNQNDFSQLVGISISSYKKYESGHSEVGAPAMLKVANHPDFKKYALWLISDEPISIAEQCVPMQEGQKQSTALTEQEYDEQLIDITASSLNKLAKLNWLAASNEKKVSLDDCAKLVFLDLKPHLT
jgi:transcriptional regulator with XRE-family HTH domain